MLQFDADTYLREIQAKARAGEQLARALDAAEAAWALDDRRGAEFRFAKAVNEARAEYAVAVGGGE